ncbi:uncharacterized protein L969DRAFT_101491 [Mixia osmundae IAM 14324]|uniref:Large ribosomal subunit protein mL44 n=1 Tax=Mixia osmundae (strain CBS 9802 / IAM 14324 / JCM 22182 / KY 12970) TaxID=764103 RepID=G7DXC8_MIXOS|nr:uncharacterized protein L969DRAFT_101491 [Mixia osmundae IAM 14324]KEI41268.1 hypothetical protein L969DRAFT_101491 [Mixia osmundae IAM 14324]GAA95238.1 hypothetical protein E5Q_01894 [Mixia osmundae IAM 14324]
MAQRSACICAQGSRSLKASGKARELSTTAGPTIDAARRANREDIEPLGQTTRSPNTIGHARTRNALRKAQARAMDHLKHLYTPRTLEPVGRKLDQDQLALLFALQVPPPTSALSALAARIGGLELNASNAAHLALLEQCCIDPSFWARVAQVEPLLPLRSQSTKAYSNYCDPSRSDNAELATLGNSLLGLFTAEHLSVMHPHLPTLATKAALTLMVGPRTCADIALSWGIAPGTASYGLPARQGYKENGGTGSRGSSRRGVGEGSRAGTGLLRWIRSESEESAVLFEEALANAAKAIVGAVFQEHGFERTRAFVQSHFFSRKADLASLLKFPDPRQALVATMRKYGRERPLTRILKETGRMSISPVFVIGVYTGEHKLGEAFGNSIKMAEHRAYEDAMKRIYLSRTFVGDDGLTDLHMSPALPTDTLIDPSTTYKPALLGDEEVTFASAGRTKRTAAEVATYQKQLFANQTNRIPL